MRLFRGLMFGIVMFACQMLGAEGRQFHFTHLSMDDGLSHNDITSIVQDQSGFMWFATRDGLNRYDGNRVKTYHHRINGKIPFDVNYILSLCEDRNGTLWVGANGISRYDAKGDSLEYFNLKTKEGNTPSNMVISIKVNSDGWIYFLEKGAGVYCYKPETGDYSFYPFKESEQERSTFLSTAMWIDGSNRVWLGGDKGRLFLLDQSSGRYHSIKIDCLRSPNDQLQVITGNEHFIYLGFQYSGIIRYDLSKKSFSNLSLGVDEREVVFVHDILIDENILWVATEKGLYSYDETTKRTTRLKRDYFDPLSLSDNAIYSVYKDRDNGLWVGTYFGGINYVSLVQNRFIEFYYPLIDKFSLKGKAVREICQDTIGNIWIGTEDAGLNCFNPETKTMIPMDIGLDHYNVHGMKIIGDELYIGVFSGGLNIYNLQTREISRYYISDNKYNVDNSIYSICYDQRKRIWICTQKGVYWFERSTGKFTPVKGLEDIYVHNICEDSKGNIWLASIGNSLICYTIDGKIINYQEILHQKTGYSINRILSVFEDIEKRLWIATSGYGLICYDIVQDSMIRYSMSNGLPDDMAYKAVQDNLGNIWVGTNRGLVRINPSTNKIRVFTKSDGLLTNQFNFNSAFRDAQNRLYFGTIEGLSVVDPSEIKDDLTFPPVFLTNFQLHNKDVRPGVNSPLKQSITYTKELTLDYNQNFISFDYAVLRYGASQKNMCYIKLEGLDKDWILVDNTPRISYSNLRPGNYKLRIKSSNSTGEWKENCTLDICILPPWWASSWAYTFYGALLLIAFIMFYFYVKRRIYQKQKKLILRVEQEKERESYHAKIEFFTNIAHEIKTPLTLIRGPLEYIIHNKSFDVETKESLDTVMKNTERLLSLTYQLLDFRRIEAKQMRMKFEQIDVVVLSQTIYDRFKLPAEQQGIRFDISLPESPLSAEVDVEAFTKIISNLFTNALKYSSTYISMVLAKVDKEYFFISVENDGEVISQQMREKIFEPFVQVSSQGQVGSGRGLGLPLARSLAELHGGSLQLDITCTENNRFVLRLPYSHAIRSEKLNEEESLVTNDIDVEKVQQTVLIVEDNLEMLEFISKKMMSNYEVLRAMDGLEAIKVLNEAEVDLVISDIMMPNMDGMELLETIKSQVEYSHIPVILLTAKSNLQSKIEGLELGADAYIEKPFSLEYLQAQVQSLLKNRKLVKELFSKRPLTEANVVALTKADELFLQKVNAVIEANLANLQFSVDLLAEKLNMSRSSLHRKIKGLSDLTPNDYIRLHRLKRAAILLQEGNYRVNEIASLTGFTSSSYFTKCFQQHFEMLPKNFAKTINN